MGCASVNGPTRGENREVSERRREPSFSDKEGGGWQRRSLEIRPDGGEGGEERCAGQMRGDLHSAN